MATIGPSPFGNYEEYRKFRAASKKEVDSRWSKAHGWRSTAKRSRTKKVTSSLGTQYEIPEEDFDEYLTFYRTQQSELSDTYKEGKGRLKNVETPADYIDYVFGEGSKAEITEQAGKGHIDRLWYSQKYQLLKVQFAPPHPSIVVYFRVPMSLAATLMSLAESDATRPGVNGRRGHLLGIYFWDLIRIRGTVHGSRYKFEYVSDQTTGGSPGRVYGSGKNVWTKETGPNKNIAAQIDGVKQYIEELKQNKAMFTQLANMSDADRAKANVGHDAVGAIQELLKQTDDAIQLATERLNELQGSQYDVTRNTATPKYAKPKNPKSWLGNNELGNVSALEGLSAEQTEEVRTALGTADPRNEARYRAQQDLINAERTKREAQRRISRNWDIDRLEEYIDTLAAENRLPGGMDSFYTKFTNAGDQFDFLKHSGLIPPNAIYK